MTESKQLFECLDFAKELANEAGAMLIKYRGEIMERIYTSRRHFRTVADEAIDGMVVAAIQKRFPCHAIHSEESGSSEKDSPWKWVVDAVDGTINLWSGLSDHCAFCISLNYEGRPVLGVVHAALRKEYYYAATGIGAFCNDKQIRVSDVANVNQVLMGIDSGKVAPASHIPYLAKAYGSNGVTFASVNACASVPLTLVGSGVLHAYLATCLEPEDMAASVIIIREAGGTVTNLQGKEWSLKDPSILAANPVLHKNLGKFFDVFD